jgi:hypothetical protein
MTNSEKAKAVVKALRWNLEDAAKTMAKLNAEDAAAAAYKKAVAQTMEKYMVDDGPGFGPTEPPPDTTYHDHVREVAVKELEACREIYEYALEVFLDKIPEPDTTAVR